MDLTTRSKSLKESAMDTGMMTTFLSLFATFLCLLSDLHPTIFREEPKIENILTEKETEVYKSGRNTHVKPPKNATAADYHCATGLEALFGYLYLQNDIARIRELYSYTYMNDTTGGGNNE